ncbi:MAG TPA: PAS domain S-box protein [Polyangia bacterium]|jgi:PAS domain S-box/PAS domain S-box/PAS domain S-box/PAS domain S-box|nr:PAS domain S-box protein [Polyangia bacterium]
MNMKEPNDELQIKNWAIESAINAIVICDLKGKLTYVNPAFLRLWGYDSPAEVLGRSAPEFWATAAQTQDIIRQLAVTGGWIGELEAKAKHGSLFQVQVSASMIKSLHGEPNRMMVWFVDITKPKQTEQALQASEDRFRKIVEQAPIAMAVVASDGKIEFINRKAIAVFQYLPDDIPTMDRWWVQAYPDAVRRKQVVADWTGRVQKAVNEACEIVGNEYRVTCKDGSVRTMFISGVPVSDRIFVMFDDISERKQAEEALRESEERFSKAFQTSPYAYIIANAQDGAFVEVNDAFTSISGYTREEALASSTLNLGIWVDATDRQRMVATLRAGRAVVGLETRLRAKDGTVRTVLLSAQTIRLGQRVCTISIVEDITERKRAEESVAAEKERLAVTLRSIGDAVIATDVHANIVLMNKVAETLTGWSLDEAAGRPLIDVLRVVNESTRQQLQNPVEQVLASGKTVALADHTLLIGRDGTERVISDSAAPINDSNDAIVGVVLVLRDITEKQQLTETIQRAARLDSLGILAGGIAHDFNNLLTGIYGYLDLARATSHEPEPREYLEATLATINRARALTMQLLTFAKGGSPARKTTPLLPFIQDAAQFALSGSSVSCQFDIPPGLRPCSIDKQQIGQVIDNIVINAKQAMPGGGAVEISARNIAFAEGEHPPLAKGDYVRISIKDHGIGIPMEILPHIFDPFYTTKTEGHGLGLATCYSIINRHDGCIDVESRQGKGSTFHFYLPASTETAVASSVPTIERRGSGTIIVVDDDAVVRHTVQRMLESLGYTVVCKHEGKEAIDFYVRETNAKACFVAMILDLTIPGGMGGVEAVAAMRKLNKDIPIFVASGYADNSVMRNPIEHGFTASISKPFTISDLSQMLRKYLSAGAAA